MTTPVAAGDGSPEREELRQRLEDAIFAADPPSRDAARDLIAQFGAAAARAPRLDTSCDHDHGLTCKQQYPASRSSWCEGCLNTLVEAAPCPHESLHFVRDPMSHYNRGYDIGFAEGQRAAARAPGEPLEPRACPCLHTTPCSPRCTCVQPFSSHGCARCCSYGSSEQQRVRAEALAAGRSALPPPHIDIAQRLAALEWVLNRAEEIVRDEHGKDAAYSFEQAWGELPKTLRAALPRVPEPDLSRQLIRLSGSGRLSAEEVDLLERAADALRASRGEARVQSEQEKNDDDAVSRRAPSDG